MEVWVLQRWSADIHDKVFCGVFKTDEGVRKYILGWADYIIEDAKQYGGKDDVAEAEKEAAELKAYYGDYDFSKVRQHMFAKGFEAERTILQD